MENIVFKGYFLDSNNLGHNGYSEENSSRDSVSLRIKEEFHKTRDRIIPRKHFIKTEIKNAENNRLISRFLARRKIEKFHLINGEEIIHETYLDSENNWISKTEKTEIIRENQEKIPSRNPILVLPVTEKDLDGKKRKYHATKIELIYILLNGKKFTFPFFPNDKVTQEIFW